MISLPSSDAHRIRRLFESEHASLVIDAIIAGHSPARIWIDDQDPGTEVEAGIGSAWNSIDDFKTAGFGFCVHDGRSIACWCTAEYVSAGRCGIGIETIGGCRRRGFATAATQAFLAHCSARQLTAHWDSWADNTPSIAVAEKTGFAAIETYSVFVVSPDIQWPARYGGFTIER